MRKSPLYIIFTTILIDLIGFGIVLPVLPLYASEFGADAFTIGMIVGSFSLMQFIFMPVWGRVSDRIGRRPVILMSLLASGVSYVMYASAHSLTLLVLSRIFGGVAGATISTAQAYITDVTTPENRARGMGLIGAAFGLGLIFGPIIGGFLSDGGRLSAGIAGVIGGSPGEWLHLQVAKLGTGVRFDIPAYFAALLCIGNAVLAYFRLPESLAPEFRRNHEIRILAFREMRESMRKPGLGALLLFFFITTFSFTNIHGTLPLYSEKILQLNVIENSTLFAIMGATTVVIQGGLIGRLTKKYGERRLLFVGTILMIIGFFTVAFSFSYGVLVSSLILLSAGTALNGPVIPSIISQRTKADEHGSVLGISQSVASLGRIAGPPLGGFAFANIGVRWPFIIGGLTMIIAAYLAWSYFHHVLLPAEGNQ